MSKKRHEIHEEHADESWLVPYADILTLLLALFIVLFASSSVDQEKYERIVSIFKDELGAYIATTDAPPTSDPAFVDWDTITAPPKDSDKPPEPTDGPGNGDPALNNLYQSLLMHINENNMGDSIGVEYNGEHVLITLKSDIWFRSGSADVTADMREQALMLAELIKKSQDPNDPFDVIVAGHTDNVPIDTARYPSNWYLSMYRAVNFMAEMLSEGDLDPTFFSSRGYGEFRPIGDNNTTEGKQRNRRVELLLTKHVLEAGETSGDGGGEAAD